MYYYIYMYFRTLSEKEASCTIYPNICMDLSNDINDTSGTCHVIFIGREQVCSVPKVLPLCICVSDLFQCTGLMIQCYLHSQLKSSMQSLLHHQMGQSILFQPLVGRYASDFGASSHIFQPSCKSNSGEINSFITLMVYKIQCYEYKFIFFQRPTLLSPTLCL